MSRPKTDNELRSVVGETYARLRDEGIITNNTEGLAYTQQFETLFAEVRELAEGLTDSMDSRRVVFKNLVNLRKQGKAVTQLTPKTDKEKRELNIHQVRILSCLTQYPLGLNRAEIADRANVTANMVGILGPTMMEDVKKVEEERGAKTLLGLGYVQAKRLPSVKRESIDVVVYSITGRGREALRKYIKGKSDARNTTPKQVPTTVEVKEDEDSNVQV